MASTSVSGIHYSGVGQKESPELIGKQQNIIIVGSFKRGRLDKPFRVTKADCRALLGFDYQNPYYQVVEDLLKNGAQYVWIQRVG